MSNILNQITRRMLMTLGGVAPGSTLLNGIQAYYKFDETSGTNANDEIGSIDGTLANGASFTATGKINNGVYIADAGDQVSMGNNFNFDYNDDFTYSVWIKRVSIGGIKMIMSKYATANKSMFMFFNSDKIEFNLLNVSGSNALTIKTANSYTDTSGWHHYLLTYDGTSHNAAGTKLYVDNVLQTWGTIAKDALTATILNTAPFELGNRNTNSFGLFGHMDEFGVWDRVLTVDERNELYNSGAGEQHPFGPGVPTPPSLLGNLFSYYKMNETSGTVLVDTFSNADGTINEGSLNATGKIGSGYNITSVGTFGTDFGSAFNYEYTQPTSYNMWINPDINPTSKWLLTKFDNDSEGRGWHFSIGFNNKLTYSLQNDSVYRARVTIDTPLINTIGQWYMITVTNDGSGNANGINIYVDGVLGSKTINQNNFDTIGSPSIISNKPLTLGSDSRNGTLSFEGDIDELGIWTKVLSQSEITDLYNSGAGFQHPFV